MAVIQLLNYIIEKGKKSDPLIQHELMLNFYLSPSLVVWSLLLSCFCTAHVSQTPKCVEAITSLLLRVMLVFKAAPLSTHSDFPFSVVDSASAIIIIFD